MTQDQIVMRIAGLMNKMDRERRVARKKSREAEDLLVKAFWDGVGDQARDCRYDAKMILEEAAL